MKKNVLLITLATVFISAHAQMITNNGATIRNNGSVITTVGGGIDNNGIISNNGNVIIDGDYKAISAFGFLINESDTIFINGNFDNSVGIYDGSASSSYSGTMVFDGLNQNITTNSAISDEFYNIVVDNGGAKSLNGTLLIYNNINFSNGIIETNPIDTLGLLTNCIISGTPGTLSHVNGMLYREGKNVVSNLAFPLGDGVRYRPLVLMNVPVGATSPVFGFEATRNLVVLPSSPGYGVEALNNGVGSFRWRGKHYYGNYTGGAQVMLSYKLPDGLDSTIQNYFVVARSQTLNGSYDSYDVSSTSNNTVTSLYDLPANVTNNFFLIGRSANMRADVSAFIEGAHTGAGTLHDSLSASTTYLSDYFEYSGAFASPIGFKMLEGQTVPTGAVDYIELYLRSTAAGANLDTAYCWLMSDGSIRDFGTGTSPYATFKNYNTLISGNTYYLVAKHRNHIPIMFNAPVIVDQDVVTPPMFDLGNIANIYGGGAKLISGDACMYAGNAETTVTPNEVNALDLWHVGNNAANIMTSDYILEDVNLSGTVNNTDWDITSWSNDQLYFSTVP